MLSPMASKKLLRDLLVSRQSLFVRLTSHQASSTRLRLLPANTYSATRGFGVFNEFSKKIKGEAERNPEFQQSVKELKEKAEELKEVKEELKVRTKKKTEQLYKQVDGVWTEAESTAKKVSSDMKEKISAATEEVKETLGIGKQNSSGSTGTSAEEDANFKQGSQSSSGEEKQQQFESNDTAETVFGKFKSRISSSSISSAFKKLKDAKIADMAKKGYDIVKEELSNSPSKRNYLIDDPPPSNFERSTRTEITMLPSRQSRWETLKKKMQDYPVFRKIIKKTEPVVEKSKQQINKIAEPVVEKSKEIAEDLRERYETSDNPIVHKIQDINDSMSQETDAALSYKEIRRMDPSFSLADFVAQVQEAVKPVLNAYVKGDVVTLKKYCSPELIERCKAEHTAYQSHGIFFDNKILHVSEVEVRDTKMMGPSPIIIIMFQTQQIYCVRDRNGAITEGGKDTIHTVYYHWAMQRVDPEELGNGSINPVWRLREMAQQGIQALI
ncbi:mitochondrial import inner membrane translocase subunit TIM44-2-like [Quillaja saponaria]|uniref:Mitochondrial import inner membrane translocase subunit TIM44-2-like n=1 Tax=Quillaja saponaria TaxID=32244 RepID=A0AAD7Q0M5_QUISA|nr:mitochondrial import inner membrane translocase subunit TIM44-2-like [Quillaja saponaria]